MRGMGMPKGNITDMVGNRVIYTPVPPFNNLHVTISYVGRKAIRHIGIINKGRRTLYIKESFFKANRLGVMMLKLPILLFKDNPFIDFIYVKSTKKGYTIPVGYVLEHGQHTEMYETFKTNVFFNIKELKKICPNQ